MNKTELKKKLEETKAKLKTNSKDQHFADALISDLLSIKGQLDHEPTLAHIPLSDVEAQLKGDTFEMSITKSGDAVYHTYGGYTIIASPRLASLNGTIKSYVLGQEYLSDLTEDERNIYDLNLSATNQLLSAPAYAFCDEDLAFDISKLIIEWVKKSYDELMSKPLQPENGDTQVKWEDATKAVDDISKTLNKS